LCLDAEILIWISFFSNTTCFMLKMPLKAEMKWIGLIRFSVAFSRNKVNNLFHWCSNVILLGEDYPQNVF